MAKYTITYRCEHDGEAQIAGPEKDRPGKATWLASQVCPECKREQTRLGVEEWTEARGLVKLEGSEKQISWALNVRKGLLVEMDKYIDPSDESEDMGYIIRAHKLITSQTQAKWWIDHRQQTGKSLLLKMVQQEASNAN